MKELTEVFEKRKHFRKRPPKKWKKKISNFIMINLSNKKKNYYTFSIHYIY